MNQTLLLESCLLVTRHAVLVALTPLVAATGRQKLGGLVSDWFNIIPTSPSYLSRTHTEPKSSPTRAHLHNQMQQVSFKTNVTDCTEALM